MSRLGLASLIGCLLAGPAAAQDAADGPGAYRDAVYAFNVARYCGFADWLVGAGFRIGLREIAARDAVGAAAARAARRAAVTAFERDWRNRGSGANDPRCAGAGRAAADRFRAVVMESRRPDVR